jgi:putative chitinase
VFDASQITAIAPQAPSPDIWATALSAACEQFEINTTERIAAFLAQVAFESNSLTVLEENCNYSSNRLLAVFPRDFVSLTAAVPYANNPQKTASLVYAGKYGNGPESSGDGWTYHGRGPIQITFKDNYASLAKALSNAALLSTPSIVATRQWGSLAAAWFFSTRGCNELADSGDFTGITRKINGGLNGLTDREVYWERAKNVFPVNE